jgi:hypothetical protein
MLDIIFKFYNKLCNTFFVNVNYDILDEDAAPEQNRIK